MSEIQKISIAPKKTVVIKDKVITVPIKASNMQKKAKKYRMSEGGMVKDRKY